MLIGDADIRPDFSIYYWASKFILFTKENKLGLRPFLLYHRFINSKFAPKLGFPNFVYILEFLFMIEFIELDSKGNIILCQEI
jgi:hypothetical protein